MFIGGRWEIEESFVIQLGFNRRRRRVRRLLRVTPPPGRRRAGEKVADVVAVDEEGVPVDEGFVGVDERRRRIVVEQEGVASHYFQIHFSDIDLIGC